MKVRPKTHHAAREAFVHRISPVLKDLPLNSTFALFDACFFSRLTARQEVRWLDAAEAAALAYHAKFGRFP